MTLHVGSVVAPNRAHLSLSSFSAVAPERLYSVSWAYMKTAHDTRPGAPGIGDPRYPIGYITRSERKFTDRAAMLAFRAELLASPQDYLGKTLWVHVRGQKWDTRYGSGGWAAFHVPGVPDVQLHKAAELPEGATPQWAPDTFGGLADGDLGLPVGLMLTSLEVAKKALCARPVRAAAGSLCAPSGQGFMRSGVARFLGAGLKPLCQVMPQAKVDHFMRTVCGPDAEKAEEELRKAQAALKRAGLEGAPTSGLGVLPLPGSGDFRDPFAAPYAGLHGSTASWVAVVQFPEDAAQAQAWSAQWFPGWGAQDHAAALGYHLRAAQNAARTPDDPFFRRAVAAHRFAARLHEGAYRAMSGKLMRYEAQAAPDKRERAPRRPRARLEGLSASSAVPSILVANIEGLLLDGRTVRGWISERAGFRIRGDDEMGAYIVEPIVSTRAGFVVPAAPASVHFLDPRAAAQDFVGKVGKQNAVAAWNTARSLPRA